MKFGVSEVGSASVPTVTLDCENPKMAVIRLIAVPYLLRPCKSSDIQSDT